MKVARLHSGGMDSSGNERWMTRPIRNRLVGGGAATMCLVNLNCDNFFRSRVLCRNVSEIQNFLIRLGREAREMKYRDCPSEIILCFYHYVGWIILGMRLQWQCAKGWCENRIRIVRDIFIYVTLRLLLPRWGGQAFGVNARQERIPNNSWGRPLESIGVWPN